MTATRGNPVVLVVDDDLGLVCWLGQIFSEVDCRVVPALNCRQAVSLTAKLNVRVDVIVVNPELERVPEMIQKLSFRRTVKVVALRNHDGRDGAAIGADSRLERPSAEQPLLHEEWLERARGVLR